MLERISIITSPGHSGSMWLSKVINSHFHAISLHEVGFIRSIKIENGQFLIRPYFAISDEEKISSILYFLSTSAQYRNAYKVIVLVENSRNYITYTAVDIAQKLKLARVPILIFHLIRHPVLVVNSMSGEMMKFEFPSKLVEGEARYIQSALAGLPISSRQAIAEILQKADIETVIFATACLVVLGEIQSFRFKVFRLEDMTSSSKALADALRQITGLEYNVTDELFEKVNVKKNQKDPAVVWERWDRKKREIFKLAFPPEVLRKVGYQIPE